MIPMILAGQHGAATNYPPTRIVVHGTVSPCRSGGARKVAGYFRTVKRPASAHLVTDPVETVRCVPDNVVAYHAPPNRGSLGHELCDPQAGSSARWSDDEHQAMLQRAARDDADWCVTYGIPIRKLSVAEVRAGVRGLCDHHDVSRAFGQSTHVDVGDGFPWPQYISLVARAARGPVVKAPNKVVSAVAKARRRLVVDGDMGPLTWDFLALVLRQPKDDRVAIVRQLQRVLQVPVDGQLGLTTTRALQRRLGVRADGVWGPATTKALQRRLNVGRV